MKAATRALHKRGPAQVVVAVPAAPSSSYSGGDGQEYGFAAAFGAGESCEHEAVEQLVDLQRHALEYARRDGLIAEDEQFYAEQNAKLVEAAEMYYRTMFGGRVSAWNLRDRHMTDTLDRLVAHLTRQRGQPARIVVWAHTHISATPALPRWGCAVS
jgi:erythromycin esterase-like protein